MKTKKQLVKINNFLIFLTINFFIVTLGLLGATLNAYAIMNNDCKMPVYFSEYQFVSNRHFSYTDFNQVNSPILTDIIKIPLNYDHYISIGDVLIYISFPLVIINFIVYLFRKK